MMMRRRRGEMNERERGEGETKGGRVEISEKGLGEVSGEVGSQGEVTRVMRAERKRRRLNLEKE